MARLRNYFLTGLVVCAPLAITLYITWWLVGLVDSWVKPYIPARWNPDTYLPFVVPGFGLIVAILLITLIGFLAANFIGRSILGYGERMLAHTPFVRNVYSGVKQIFETVVANRTELFNKVGLIEYPRRGAWSVVLIASERENEINEALREREGKTVAVFRPITPNVTTGYLMYVPESDIIPLSITVEEAAKLLLSAGLVAPETPQRPTVEAMAAEPGPAAER